MREHAAPSATQLGDGDGLGEGGVGEGGVGEGGVGEGGDGEGDEATHFCVICPSQVIEGVQV